MPHFAEVNTQTNEVLRVIRAKSKLWCEYELNGTWFRNYYDTEGTNYAGIGYIYHPEKENLPQLKPYPSWVLNDQCHWQAPVPRPDDNKSYTWNDETQSWEENNLRS